MATPRKRTAPTPPPAAPSGSTEPDNTQDLEAQAAEAVDESPTVEFDGITYTIDADSAGDVELVEALADYVEEGNGLRLPYIVKTMIGPDQYDAFKNAAREPETGRVPMTKLRAFFLRIDDALGE